MFETTSATGKRKLARPNTRSPPENPTGNGIYVGLTLTLDTLTITTAEGGRIITLRGFPHCGNPVFLGFSRLSASTLLRLCDTYPRGPRPTTLHGLMGARRTSGPADGKEPRHEEPLAEDHMEDHRR